MGLSSIGIRGEICMGLKNLDRIIEMNTCGIAERIKISFLYSYKKKPSLKKLQEIHD